MKKLSLSLCLLFSVGTSSLWSDGYRGPSFFQYRHADELQNRPLAAIDIQNELDMACARFDANTPPHAYDNVPSTDINHLNTFQAASHLASLFEAHVLRDDGLRTRVRETEGEGVIESFINPRLFEDGGFSQRDLLAVLLSRESVFKMQFLQKLSRAMHNGHHGLFGHRRDYNQEERSCRNALRNFSGLFDDWEEAFGRMRSIFLHGAMMPYTMRLELLGAGVQNIPDIPQPYGRFPNSILEALQTYENMEALAPQGHAWSPGVQTWLGHVDALRQRVDQDALEGFDPAHLANLKEHLPTLLNSVMVDGRLLRGADHGTQGMYRLMYQALQYTAHMPSYEGAKEQLRRTAGGMDNNQNPVYILQRHPFSTTWTELVDNRIAFTENNETKDRQNLALEKLLPIAVYCAQNLHQGNDGMEALVRSFNPPNNSPSAVVNAAYAFVAESVRGHRRRNPQ